MPLHHRVLFTILPFALYGSSVALAADEWQCSTGSTSSGAALCYVTNVRYFPGTTSYVKAKIHDPSGVSACDYITVTEGGSAQSAEEVRASESLLLTALTTGLPVKFYKLDSGTSLPDCAVNSVIVARPGN